ncbi:polyprenyl synthetase family protein [Ferviditalea candida]|uniref:Polyprenyl synthetase family protein n=1 Tax=Ferviditalea candida TaxID=3108399 RepID=A0ABU5ZI67_9BACL|nr:polyprenyl synthetase family protein [Paenibacillaceae bacterium T2]
MRDTVVEQMRDIVDRYMHHPKLNELVLECVQEKIGEQKVWSEHVLNCHFFLGGSSPYIERLAANLELIVLAGDILDDLQDQDHQQKVWLQAPPALALNAAVAMLTAAFGDISTLSAQHSELAENRVVEQVSRLLALSLNGQHGDLCNDMESEQGYLSMAAEKSGSLIRLAFMLGYAPLRQPDRTTIERLDQIAVNIGVMAQLENDLRDVLSFDEKNDLLGRKRTLPIQYLLRYSEEDLPLFKQYFEGAATRETFLESRTETLEFVRQSGCVEYTRAVQMLLFNETEELFMSIPGDPHWKSKFREDAFARFGR